MPAPKITFTTNSNPTSTVTIPHIALRTEKAPWASYSGLAASTTYTLATAANTPVDLEPGLYAIGVQDTAEAALFWFGGTTATILKVGGSTNVVTGASPSATQISLYNNSGVLEIRTGSGTLVGTTILFKRMD